MVNRWLLPASALVMLVSGCATQPVVAPCQCPELPKPPAVVQAVKSAPPAPSYLESAKELLDLLNRLIENAPD